MNKTKNHLSYYFLSLLIPLFICILSCVALHITPFGDHSLMISDANSAYIDNLGLIRDIFTGKRDFLYSLNNGLGDSNMIGWGFGSFHPLFLLAIFCDIMNYPQLFTWISIIDFSICGFTMYLLLEDISNEWRESKETNFALTNLIFSTSYALIGFNVANVFQVIFFTGVQLLPIIVLGLRRLLNKKSPALYVISLAGLILTNFYFGYMICILSAVLFLIWLFGAEKNSGERKQISLRYFVSSGVAGLMSAFIWLPALISQKGARLDQNSLLDFSMKENMPILDMFSKFFTGANDTSELSAGLPNVFCGILVLYFVIVFFVDKKNDIKNKIIHGIPILFYALTFYIVAFSMCMQGFSKTNWFNFRYSFAFSFLMILTAADEFRRLEDISKKTLGQALSILLGLTILTFSKEHTFVSGGEMLIDVALLSIMLFAILWHKSDPIKAPANILSILLLLLCCINIYANYTICTYKIRPFEKTVSDFQKSILAKSALMEGIKSKDDNLYRMESDDKGGMVGCNEGYLLNYNGVASFGSSKKTTLSRGLNQLGIYWHSTNIGYSHHTVPAVDSLLGLKYLVSKNNLSTQKAYRRMIGIEDDSLYENPYALPLSVLSANSLRDISFTYDVFQNINNIWKQMSGENLNIYTEEENIDFVVHESMDGTSIKKAEVDKSVRESNSIDKSDKSQNVQSNVEVFDWQYGNAYISYSFRAKHDGAIYAYNGGSLTEEYGSSAMPMQYLGTYKKGEIVKGKIPMAEGSITEDTVNWICGNFHVAYENKSLLEQYSQKLQASSGTFEKVKDSHLKGWVDVDQNSSYLFFSIPYDDGWTLYVDGQKTPLSKAGTLFMTAPVVKGQHSYELIFAPVGMREGLVVSGIAFIGFLIMMISFRINKAKHAVKEGRPFEAHMIDI